MVRLMIMARTTSVEVRLMIMARTTSVDVRLMIMARTTSVMVRLMIMARTTSVEVRLMIMARTTAVKVHRFNMVVGERRAGSGQPQRRRYHESGNRAPHATRCPRLRALTIRRFC